MKKLPYVGSCLLRELLKKRHLTVVELSMRSNIPVQQISDYINNRRCMSLKNARKITNALGNCYIDDLYTWDDDKQL